MLELNRSDDGSVFIPVKFKSSNEPAGNFTRGILVKTFDYPHGVVFYGNDVYISHGWASSFLFRKSRKKFKLGRLIDDYSK